MKSKKAKELLDRYSQGKLSLQEQAELESWYNHQAKLNPSLKDHEDFTAALNELDQAFPFHKTDIKRVKTYSWRLIGVAAAVLICISAGLYFYSYNGAHKALKFANDIKPGGNKAFLTLADGSKISLTDAINGEVAKQAGISITKSKDGQLIYNVAGKEGGKHEANLFNTIETPRGGQYQIKLPDGTQVWLNASSSLRYPAVFTGRERIVELKGEGYFEVVKDPEKPFKVKSGMQELQVLGTHFNVNAYADEAIIKTTLLEGSVRISKGKGTDIEKDVVLKPGQQSLVAAHELKVTTADLEESVAWKNGYFKFNDENIEHILKKVSRWYDVDIQYEGKMTDKIFNGKVSRYSNVSEVLQILQLTGAIEFKIEGRRIIVMP